MSDLHDARLKMVRQQLQGRGIRDQGVLEAMGKVPRERFAAGLPAADCYADRAWPIDCQQTISQPYMVALMTAALELSGGESVLEVGTGSGYQTAVLAELAGRVVTIERHPDLSTQAQAVLHSLGYGNIEFVVGDGSRGWPERAPFDRIIVTAAAAQCPSALLEQLSDGGILVIPIGDSASQTLQALRKHSGKLHTRWLTGCRFVPLVRG
jgi:protein-L-isoaspartate(D-aspartate) O-methyltransferase